MLENNKESISITVNHVKKYLGSPVYTYDKVDKEDKVEKLWEWHGQLMVETLYR